MATSEPIDVQLPAIPDHVPYDVLRTICELLGLPPEQVREIRTNYHEVTAKLVLRTHEGQVVRYGEDMATTTITIPIR